MPHPPSPPAAAADGKAPEPPGNGAQGIVASNSMATDKFYSPQKIGSDDSLQLPSAGHLGGPQQMQPSLGDSLRFRMQSAERLADTRSIRSTSIVSGGTAGGGDRKEDMENLVVLLQKGDKLSSTKGHMKNVDSWGTALAAEEAAAAAAAVLCSPPSGRLAMTPASVCPSATVPGGGEGAEDDEIMEDVSQDGSGDKGDSGSNFRSIGDLPDISLKQELRSLSKWYLLSIVVLIPAMIMWIEYTTQTCPRLQSVCAGVWLIFAWLLIASLPSCLLITKVTAHWLKSTQLLHVNHFFYLVRLHEDIAYIMWTVVLFCFWRYAILTASDVIPSSETQAVTHVLGCLVAWSVLVLLKNYAVLEIAHQNLWRPYVDRIQSSLFAQYTFLLLTDFVLCGYVSEKDEEVALEFSKSNRSWQNMSIYAVMRTMSWVPKTRLQDLLTDGNGTKGGIVSKDSARGFALRLFDRLLLELEGVRVLQENGTNHRKGSGFVGVTPPQEGASVSVSPFREVQRGMVAPIRAATRTLASGLSHGAPPTTEDQEATMSPFSSVPRGAPRDQLTLWSFRPIISRPLALEIMRILDANSDESISRDEFARAFVRIYRERRSLTRSMKDYELVINKLGHIFALFMYLILLIICCLIFRLNVAQLAVTSIGLFVGFSFMFGSTATNLMESCIFIFITRAYDVGDRISFVENGEKLNCVVQQINLLSTIFINWDDQWFSVPNQAMARKQIYNQRRSLMARSKLDITVDAKTPAHVISDIESRMRQWAENTKNLTIIPSSIEFLHRNLQNPYVLGIVIVYAQTNSFQDNSQRFRNQDGFTRELTSVCKDVGVILEMPPQIVRLQQQGGEVKFSTSS